MWSRAGRSWAVANGQPQCQSLTGLRPGARFFICSLLRRNTAEHFGQWMGSFLSSSAFTTKKAWWQRRQVNGRSRTLRIGRPPQHSSDHPVRFVNVTGCSLMPDMRRLLELGRPIDL